MKKLLLLFILAQLHFAANAKENTGTPVINSFSPAYGAVGTLVKISGTNLEGITTFILGQTPALIISSTDTTLVGMVMPGAVPGIISVSTSAGTANSSNQFVVTPTPFPSAQQGNKLTGSGGAKGLQKQGWSVALSGDGNTAIVGSPYDSLYTGAAWVYTRTAGVWSQQGKKLAGTDGGYMSMQGTAVALSADGNTAIVGGIADNSNKGAVWVFIRNGNDWVQQGNKLTGSDAVTNSVLGTSVSLSADGNTAIAGGSRNGTSLGAAWIFTRNNGVWTQQGPMLVSTDAINVVNYSFKGSAVSLSADGNTAIVGGLNDDNKGGAWVFTRSNGVWAQQGTKLFGTGGTGYQQQGYAVALSADGNTAITGNPIDNSNTGAAWIFTRNGNNWVQQGNKLTGSGGVLNQLQGSAVSISGGGDTAVIGGPLDYTTGLGGIWVFVRNDNTWVQNGNMLTGADNAGNSGQGFSVAISADGKTIIEGGPHDNTDVGAAWIYNASPNGWVQQSGKLIGSGAGTAAMEHGSAVALSADGNTAIAGSPKDSVTGSVRIFTRSGGVWVQDGNKLVGTGGVGSSAQGTSVAISADGNTVVTGGPEDSSGLGAAWVYTRMNGEWMQQGPKLVGSGWIIPPPDTSNHGPIGDPSSPDYSVKEGSSIAISADGNTIVMGAPVDSGYIGALWVFTRNNGVWTQQAKLVSTGGVLNGSVIAISADGKTIVEAGNLVWIFTYNGEAWLQQRDSLPVYSYQPDIGSVAINADGTTVIVGKPLDSFWRGAAMVFIRSGNAWVQQGDTLLPNDYSMPLGFTAFGGSVSLSADGNTALIGGPGDYVYSGAVWLFTRENNNWIQQGAKHFDTTGYRSYLGASVSISANGSTAIVGGPQDARRIGALWVYEQKVEIVWTGTISADWMTAGNWAGGIVPDEKNNVIIPAGTPFSPVVFSGTNTSCKNLFVLPGATVTVETNATLNITH